MSHLHFQSLLATPVASLLHVRCHAGCGTGGEEPVDFPALVVPVGGVFVRQLGRRRIVADPARMLFFSSSEVHRVHHPIEGGDDCLSLTFGEEVLREAWGRANPAVHAREALDFGLTDLPLDPGEALAVQVARRRLLEGAAGLLEGEERLLAVLASAAGRAAEAAGREAKPEGAAARRARRERAETVQLLLARDPAANPSLETLARLLDCSPFHLARGFQRETGQPIHRHLLRLRMARSLELLPDWDEGITALALDLGFASHAHFSAAFQRTFGLSPAVFRKNVKA